MKSKRYVVGLAQVQSVYGGPEEGGWDYEEGYPIGPSKTFFNLDSALVYRAYLQSLIDNPFRGVGVGGCGDNNDMQRGEVSSCGEKAVLQHCGRKDPKVLQSWPEVRPMYS